MRVPRCSEEKECLRLLPLITVAVFLVFCAPVVAQTVPTTPLTTPQPSIPPLPSGKPSPAPTVKPTPTPKPVVVRLRADRIAFYYDRYLIEAYGHVRITTSDGMTLSGDTFSMDLRLNRFLLASHMHLRSKGGNIDGAAISDFLDFNRVYFVPVISKPDRWTYENGDFTKPLKGRMMPGDVFYFPDLGRKRPDLIASSAVIQSRNYVRFGGVRANLLLQGIPLETFYVYFGENRDLAQNSLTGANYDATWNMVGNANSISAMHVRYDELNHLYLGFEQHFAGNAPNEYAVFSVSPFTRAQKYWNLVGGERIGSRFEINTLSQVFTDAHGGATGTTVQQTTYATMTQAFNRSFITLFSNFTNYNLTGKQNSYYDGALNHPTQATLTWTSYNNRVFKTPLYLQTSVGLGFNHDAYGLQNYGGVEYTTIWNQFLGYTLSLPNIEVGDRNRPYQLYYINASQSSERQWYTIPHHINTQNTTISLSRRYSRFVNSYLAYNVMNTSDLYLHSGYQPTPIILPNGQTYTPFESFRGADTLRSTTLATTYSANPNLLTTVSVTHHDDFPVAYPGLFPEPPLNAIGLYTYDNYMGQPPWALTGEVRALIFPHIMLDVQRTYYFHFGSEIWSPSFAVQISGTE